MNYQTYPECTPSFAEQKIMNRLMLERVVFAREVSFAGLINPETRQPLRYDFYIPAFNLIIEYDGKEYHKAADVKARDAIKNKFAEENRIRLFRISGLNYIETFFKSEFWKRQTKKVAIHKPKQKQKTQWEKNHEPKPLPAHLRSEFKPMEYVKPKEKPVVMPTPRDPINKEIYGREIDLRNLRRYKKGA